MAQYILPDDDLASDMMWDAGQGGAGPYVHCSCGIDHSIPDDLPDDEYEDMHMFGYIELDGVLFVSGCAGCEKKLAKYERFIWDNRGHIRNYLKIRTDQELAWADQEKTLNRLAGID